MSDQNEPKQSGTLPSVPLQPIVRSPYFATPRTDMAHIDAGMDYAQDAYDDAWSHARGLERDLNEALCAIRQLLNDGSQVQNLNNGEVDVFRADVDGIVEFLEATSAKAMLARCTSNPTGQDRPTEKGEKE